MKIAFNKNLTKIISKIKNYKYMHVYTYVCIQRSVNKLIKKP